eukprot:NODE_1534_length_918_cov_13.978136_g1192_i0.p4 GENE.NODE_1534_length_918_cov_13.978136_g1192_i0~~NODE_1534_length_918_cov_13.978136_g1192_i0.p4  ORF type:complete len:78 (+),score=8.84 NODE_1534_length_918_cov_13.978136_g1192_i0:654-887(+)
MAPWWQTLAPCIKSGPVAPGVHVAAFWACRWCEPAPTEVHVVQCVGGVMSGTPHPRCPKSQRTGALDTRPSAPSRVN